MSDNSSSPRGPQHGAREPGNARDPGAPYDKTYYDTKLGPRPYERTEVEWSTHFATAAARLHDLFKPKRVLDVGCAKGFLVEQLRDRGIEAYGIDASSYAIGQVRDDVKPFCTVRSATEPLGEHFDLITCIEIAEHMPEDEAEKLVANLCAHTDEVVFSSTPTDFEEPTHLNVRPRAYWEGLFAANGFFANRDFAGQFLTPNAIHFRRVDRPIRAVIFSKEKPEWAVVRLRVLDPLRELEKQGKAHVTYVSSYDTSLDIESILLADLFIVGREFCDTKYSAEILEVARTMGKVVVFELDDLLWKVPRSNPVWGYCTQITGSFGQIAQRADFITASTEPLKHELVELDADAPRKTVVLRNCVNTEIWGSTFTAREPVANEPFVVGWFGSPTHQEDLEIVEEAIRYLVRKYEGAVEFHFFGYLPKNLREIPGVKLGGAGVANVEKHAKRVREAPIHLAIAPLTDHPFNQSKSDLKWLEYSICGIPGIYSDVTPYRNSVTHGVDGWLAKNTTASWVDAIERFLADAQLRRRIARTAFDVVRSNFCLDVAVSQWDRAYRSFLATGSQHPKSEITDEDATKAAALLFEFLAKNQARQGELELAVSSYEAAARLVPQAALDLRNAGIQLAKGGRFALAERLLVGSIEADPEDPAAFRVLAELYRSAGDPLAEENTLELAAEQHPTEASLALRHIELLASGGRAQAITERLAPLGASGEQLQDFVHLVERSVALSHGEAALAAVENAQRAQPTQDFTPLSGSLHVLCARGGGKPAADRLRVTVITSEPLSGTRMQRRLVAVARTLADAGSVDVRFARPDDATDAVQSSQVVLLSAPFACGGQALSIARAAHDRGVAVVVDIDEAFACAEAGSHEACAAILRSADLVTTATARLHDDVCGLAPEATVQVLATQLDLSTWSVRHAFDPGSDRSLTIGLFAGNAQPQDVVRVVKALMPTIRASEGLLDLSLWTPDGAGAKEFQKVSRLACDSPFYREYARTMQRSTIDVAVLPVSDQSAFAARGDATLLELAARRVPVIASALEPFAGTIEPGVTGWLVAGGPDAFARAVQAAVVNVESRRRVANAAWSYVTGQRTWSQHASAWLAAWTQASKRARSRVELVSAS